MEPEFDFDNLVFTKPQKHQEYLVCKIKKGSEPVTVQFPKMKVIGVNSKNIELEFGSNSYSKKVYNLLSEIDNYIVKHISDNSEEWFGKKIPETSVNQMYHKFIKSPKTTENNCTVTIAFKTKKNEITTELVDHKLNDITFDEITENSILESIAEMKYIIFSKDTCFVQWELVTSKLHRKIKKVERYGFIETPDDHPQESDDEIEIHSFF